MRSVLIIALSCLAATTAQAGDLASASVSKQLVWSDKQGLVNASGCSAKAVNDIAGEFRLSVDERPRRTRKLHQSASSNNASFTDLADYVLEVRGNLKDARGKAIQFPDGNIPLRGSFWQVAIEEGQILAVTCGKTEKTFLLFDVFIASQLEPLARVGVSAAELVLFQESEIHTPKEAERAIDRRQGSQPVFVKGAVRRAQTPRATPTPSEVNKKPETGSSSTPPPPTTPTPVPGPTNGAATETTTENNTTPPTPTPAGVDETQGNPQTVEVITGGITQVMCTGSEPIAVLANDLTKKLFSARSLEEVRPVQSFGVDKISKSLNGKQVNFVKVLFPARPSNENIGWVDSTLVQAKSRCAKTEKASKPAPPAPAVAKGLSGNCCQFPLTARPTRNYHEGMRRFRAGRKGGRLHAACDLYRPEGERVLAIAPGDVIRGRYYFYQGVYALEVRHGNGFVTRYGEITGRRANGTNQGDRISSGQTIGYVGWIGNPNISPMLHFELYSGQNSGALTRKDRRGFQRRADLLDPTNYLVKWEKEKFGTHW